jgi:DNA-binding NarL/FixJ family response regulator
MEFNTVPAAAAGGSDRLAAITGRVTGARSGDQIVLFAKNDAGVWQVHAGKKRIPHEVASQLAEHISDEALTEREIEVLQHVAAGNRNRDIAEQLFISEETVKVHVKHIMQKLGASDRTAAVAIGVRRGIIQL